MIVGRLAVTEPTRPLVPAVGLEVEVPLGLAVAPVEPVLPEALADMLPVGRVVALPLIEPPALLPLRPSEGRRLLIEPMLPAFPCLTLAT